GTAVELVVSRSARPRRAPVAANLPFAPVAAQLQQLGLVVNRVPDVFSDTAPAGTVAIIDPPASTQVPKGATIGIAVSKGPDLVTVPNVIGKDLQSAVSTVTQ